MQAVYAEVGVTRHRDHEAVGVILVPGFRPRTERQIERFGIGLVASIPVCAYQLIQMPRQPPTADTVEAYEARVHGRGPQRRAELCRGEEADGEHVRQPLSQALSHIGWYSILPLELLMNRAQIAR